jgi:hypothetical protein
MRVTKLLTTTLLIAALASAGAAQQNPHEPKAETEGTVVATANGGRYTYVQIDLDGKEIWYAVPATEFKIGERVIAPEGMPMKDFYSKTLDRTFDMVYFAGSITQLNPPEGVTLPPDHPPIEEARVPTLDEIDLSGIARPEGGKTVAEIYQQQHALAGKPVLVRGKAVKVANGILGKNWVHLRDGSGEEGSNDLTITTSDTVKAGATITASGTLQLDRDFGSGYKYDVLLEDADIELN